MEEHIIKREWEEEQEFAFLDVGFGRPIKYPKSTCQLSNRIYTLKFSG